LGYLIVIDSIKSKIFNPCLTVSSVSYQSSIKNGVTNRTKHSTNRTFCTQSLDKHGFSAYLWHRNYF